MGYSRNISVQFDKKKIFISSNNIDPEKTDVDVKEITYGFKILSSVFAGGMSKICLDNLEKKMQMVRA